MSKAGANIIEGLKQALAGNIARVTIESQVWVHETPLHRAAPELLEALKNATLALALLAQSDEGHEKYLTAARSAIAKAEGKSE